jgi:hypothetical protein
MKDELAKFYDEEINEFIVGCINEYYSVNTHSRCRIYENFIIFNFCNFYNISFGKRLSNSKKI